MPATAAKLHKGGREVWCAVDSNEAQLCFKKMNILANYL